MLHMVGVHINHLLLLWWIFVTGFVTNIELIMLIESELLVKGHNLQIFGKSVSFIINSIEIGLYQKCCTNLVTIHLTLK